MVRTIDGRKIAAEILRGLKRRSPPRTALVGVLVGENAASLSFLKEKERTAASLGVHFRLVKIPEKLGEETALAKIFHLAADPAVGGIVVELPLPRGYSVSRVLNAVSREKDPDCLTNACRNAFAAGSSPIEPLASAAVQAVLSRVRFSLRGKRIAVVGAGALVGKPVAEALSRCGAAELSVITRSARLWREKLRRYDLVISGAGHARLFSAGDIKPGGLVLDFGYSRERGRVAGDFDPRLPPGMRKNFSYTPVPGGMGPIVTAKLFENFYRLNAPRPRKFWTLDRKC